MSELLWLSETQMARLKPFFPKSRGEPWVDDRRVLSGIIFFLHNGLMRTHVDKNHGSPKTLNNRWKRWGRMGVVATIMAKLTSQAQDTKSVMIDATHLKIHLTASILAVKKNEAWTPNRADD
jgi:transposase